MRFTRFWVSVGLAISGCGSAYESSYSAPAISSSNPVGSFCPYGLAYVDADGDGNAGSDQPSIACDKGYAPAGYSGFIGDCDDTDPDVYRLYNHDSDGDGVGAPDDTLCAGDVAPKGYLIESGIPDCDDTNPELSYPYLVDADGDGVAPPDAVTRPRICGPKDHAPPYSTAWTTYPGDCDDNNPAVRTLYYQDLDGDGFAPSDQVSVCGSPGAPPPGFGILSWADCDDTRADVSPAALELWSDSLDSDCDGAVMPYGCADASCDPAAGPVAINPACTTSDLVVTNVTALTEECYRVDWTVTIANQGTVPLSDYTFVVEGPSGTTSFAVLDALAPGAQHSYPLSRRLNLSGSVRFSVLTAAPDCDLSNNVLTQIGTPRDCSY